MIRCWLLLLFIPLLAACVTPRPLAQPMTPVTSEELLARLQTLAATYDAIRGVAKVRIETGDQSLTGNQVLLVQKPDLLRTETLSPFGNPLLLVAVDGQTLNVMLPGEGRFLRGAASYRNIQRFTRLPLQLTDLVSLLLWQVPIVPYRENKILATDNGNSCLLLRADEELRQELLFDRELRLTQSSYYQGEDLILRVDYSRFDTEELPFPRSMRLEMPAEKNVAMLSFSELEVNPDISPERFLLSPPPGYTVEPLP